MHWLFVNLCCLKELHSPALQEANTHRLFIKLCWLMDKHAVSADRVVNIDETSCQLLSVHQTGWSRGVKQATTFTVAFTMDRGPLDMLVQIVHAGKTDAVLPEQPWPEHTHHVTSENGWATTTLLQLAATLEDVLNSGKEDKRGSSSGTWPATRQRDHAGRHEGRLPSRRAVLHPAAQHVVLAAMRHGSLQQFQEQHPDGSEHDAGPLRPRWLVQRRPHEQGMAASVFGRMSSSPSHGPLRQKQRLPLARLCTRKWDSIGFQHNPEQRKLPFNRREHRRCSWRGRGRYFSSSTYQLDNCFRLRHRCGCSKKLSHLQDLVCQLGGAIHTQEARGTIDDLAEECVSCCTWPLGTTRDPRLHPMVHGLDLLPQRNPHEVEQARCAQRSKLLGHRRSDVHRGTRTELHDGPPQAFIPLLCLVSIFLVSGPGASFGSSIQSRPKTSPKIESFRQENPFTTRTSNATWTTRKDNPRTTRQRPAHGGSRMAFLCTSTSKLHSSM